MTENDQAFDVFEAAKPGAQSLDRSVIDLAVAGEWGYGCGHETPQIESFHVINSFDGSMLAGSFAERFAYRSRDEEVMEISQTDPRQ
jgi:hypothetical protein